MNQIDAMFIQAHADPDMDELLEEFSVNEEEDVAGQMKGIILEHAAIMDEEDMERFREDFYHDNPEMVPENEDIDWFWVCWYLYFTKKWSGTQWV